MSASIATSPPKAAEAINVMVRSTHWYYIPFLTNFKLYPQECSESPRAAEGPQSSPRPTCFAFSPDDSIPENTRPASRALFSGRTVRGRLTVTRGPRPANAAGQRRRPRRGPHARPEIGPRTPANWDRAAGPAAGSGSSDGSICAPAAATGTRRRSRRTRCTRNAGATPGSTRCRRGGRCAGVRTHGRIFGTWPWCEYTTKRGERSRLRMNSQPEATNRLKRVGREGWRPAGQEGVCGAWVLRGR